jgi:long-chain acyl-CoA synthetase
MPNSSFTSVVELFHHRVFSTPNTVAMYGNRHGEWVTERWVDVGKRARRIACGLLAKGLVSEDRCAILSENRPDWVTIDMGILCCGGATTAIYPSTTGEECCYILEDSESSYLFIENTQQLSKVLSAVTATPRLKTIILMDTPESKKLPESPIELISLKDLLALGDSWDQENPETYDKISGAISSESLASIIYTSGTTGPPKGVMLTHDNWIFESEAIDRLALMQPIDKHYLFLPLAHSFAKVLEVAFIRLGTPTVVDGNSQQLLKNMQETQPTLMGAVPRLFEKAYNGAVHSAKQGGGASLGIFKWAVRIGTQCSELRESGKEPRGVLAAEMRVADRLVFSKFRDTFGGNIKYFISGGAPLSVEIARFFHAAGILILEGYGLTESSAASFVNTPDSFRFGTVGAPVLGLEVKIAGDGEIMLKGRGVMLGYHKQPKETAHTITDGWLNTGDIGVLEDGFLRITDRKKEIIVNSGGKNISPQNVENLIKSKCGLVSDIVVFGDKQPYLIALITIDESVALHWGKTTGREHQTYKELISTPALKATVWSDITAANATLAPHECVRKIAILPKEFTEDSSELTPTQKVKRQTIFQHNKELISDLYSDTIEAF